ANSLASAGLFNTFGTPFTDQTGAPLSGDIILRELFYTFTVGDTLQFAVGPRLNWYRYFDGNAFTFFGRGASSFNASGSTLANAIDRGAGAFVNWAPTDWVDVSLAYMGENTEFLPGAFFNTATDPSDGLFGATNTLTTQVRFQPTPGLNLRFLYTRSLIDNNVPIFDESGNLTGFGVGGATGEPIYGVADDGFGGSIEPAIADTFGFNFDWRITPRVGLFGRYFFGNTEIDPAAPGRDTENIDAQAIQAGVAFPDLGREGSLLTFSYVIPFSILDGREFLASGGGDGGVQYELEATYFLPVTDNIALVPAVYMINNPNNFSDNPTIWVGNLRTQFSF
ncbi:MAG: iron uptake porin, partial [Cyanobacteria bacterium P01_A01_bin.135]